MTLARVVLKRYLFLVSYLAQEAAMNLEQRIVELEQRVRDQHANLELAWQTINLQSQVIRSIKPDDDDDLMFLVEPENKNTPASCDNPG